MIPSASYSWTVVLYLILGPVCTLALQFKVQIQIQRRRCSVYGVDQPEVRLFSGKYFKKTSTCRTHTHSCDPEETQPGVCFCFREAMKGIKNKKKRCVFSSVVSGWPGRTSMVASCLLGSTPPPCNGYQDKQHCMCVCLVLNSHMKLKPDTEKCSLHVNKPIIKCPVRRFSYKRGT